MKHRPFPEIVTGEHDWEVFEDTERPRTDMTNRKMYVPLDDDCPRCGLQHGRMVRRHELGHVKWSPKSMGKLKKNVVEEAVHLLEEIRINTLLTLHKIPMDEPHKCLEDVKMFTRQLVEKGSIAEILKWCLAGTFYRNHPRSYWYDRAYWHPNSNGRKYQANYEYHKLSHELEATLEAMYDYIDSNTLTMGRIKDLEYVIETTKYFHERMVTVSTKSRKLASNISFQRVKNYAEELSDILNMFNQRPEEDEVMLDAEAQKQLEELLEDEELELTQEQAYDEAGLIQPTDMQELHRRNKKDELEVRVKWSNSKNKPVWGEMEIHTPPCTINLSNKLRQGYVKTPKEYGQTPNNLQRYCVDKKVFSKKTKVYGGTVLIDASGSMNFDGNDILEIMSEVPAVTIAMYNGMGRYGNLRIIARNGRRVDDDYIDYHSGRGNVIDKPALEWLGRQEPKRLWVSDMYVVPTNETSRQALDECLDIVRKYNITRLANIDEVKLFAKQLNVLK
tara:strand:- start:3880 stop:5391 length:1512 start_codon:yes stop_codon:yes gene_type:complete